MIVRPATRSDAPAIAILLGELGYPATAADVVERLKRLADSPFAITLVAVDDDRVVGLVTGHQFVSIHSTPIVAWITTLVVDPAARGRGAGRELATAVEGWAQQAGAISISVSSGIHREAAHAFYERLHYARSGVRLTKTLGS